MACKDRYGVPEADQAIRSRSEACDVEVSPTREGVMDNRLKGETEGILFNGKSKQTYFFRSVSHSLNDHEGISDAKGLQNLASAIVVETL